MISVEELRKQYNKKQGGHFFDKETLDFFGERLHEMKVTGKETVDGHECYVLVTHQHNAPGGTRAAFHYFDTDTFEVMFK